MFIRVLRRLASMLGVSLVLSFVLFGLVSAMPGDPEDTIRDADPTISSAELARLSALRGDGRSLLERYGCWLRGHDDGACAWWPASEGLLRGDLGHSRAHGVAVRSLLRERARNTARLMIPAFAIAILVAIPLATIAASRRARWFDRSLTVLSMAAISTPAHGLALVSVLVFSIGLGWLPASGVDDVHAPSTASRAVHTILPVAVLATFYTARWTRFLRASLIEALRQDLALALRARGLSERTILWRHALASSMIPFIAVVTQSLPALFSGTIVLERAFSYPGIGMLIVESLTAEDHAVAVVIFSIYAALTMLATWAGDTLFVLVDPRLRQPRIETSTGAA